MTVFLLSTFKKLSQLLPCLAMMSCSVFHKAPETVPGGVRLEQFRSLQPFPVSKGSTVRWNNYHVPYVIGETDEDAAFLIGVIHAHLRLGQMELLKRIAFGRLSELGGPFLYDVDVAIRSLRIRKTAEQSIRLLPEETHAWLDRVVEGVNHYKTHTKELPREFSILNMTNEPWTVEDSLSIARLAGADINWFAILSLLKIESESDQKEFFEVLEATAKWGSNSLVVTADRSATGSPLVANDPHLGFTFPNFWLLSGIKSPSYEVVGMSVPGVPTFAPGRNRNIAWGGTNMRAWLSDFVDVTDMSSEKITHWEEEFKIRWWFDDSENLRHTPYGPIVSDLDVFDFPEGKDIALRWIGMLPSDDITPFLKLSSAPNGEQVKKLFGKYALPALNILYADTKGNTGHVLATTIPKREEVVPKSLFVTMSESDSAWSELLGSTTLPEPAVAEHSLIVSANNNPIPGKSPVVGWFFSPSQRVDRMREILGDEKKVRLEDLKRVQTDVFSGLSFAFTRTLSQRSQGILEEEDFDQAAIDALFSWDGNYDTSSRGAVLFEAVFASLSKSVFGSTQNQLAALYLRLGTYHDQFFQKLDALPRIERRKIIIRAFRELEKAYDREVTWGDIHQIQVGHVLSRVPFVGKRYVTQILPAGGSRETLMKSQHDLGTDTHMARFGSQSRHLSDLSDPDMNFFVLLGGQDGWISSEHFADQIPLWERIQYLQLPITDSKIEELFPIQTSTN